VEPLHATGQLALLKDAIEFLSWRLSGLPPSPEVEELRLKAEEYLREAERFKLSPPTTEQREGFIKRVLRLRSKLAKLERASKGRVGG
jgi:hypothetical protein